MMKTTEMIEQEIRTIWFDNHQAELIENNSVTSLQWKEKGTAMYAVTYLFSGNNLIVTGDIGEAIFSFTDRINLETFKDINISYLMKKLSCSSVDRWRFNPVKACLDLNEWLEEKIQFAFLDDIRIQRQNELFRELHGNLLVALDDNSTAQSFDYVVWKQYEESSLDIEGEEWETISEFGRELPTQFRAYLIGLEMAIAQLDQK